MKKEKDVDIKIKMISAVTEALAFRRIEQDNEKILSHISLLVSGEKNEETKLAMIAAASKSLEVADAGLKDKEIIKKVIQDSQNILKNIKKI